MFRKLDRGGVKTYNEQYFEHMLKALYFARLNVMFLWTGVQCNVFSGPLDGKRTAT